MNNHLLVYIKEKNEYNINFVNIKGNVTFYKWYLFTKKLCNPRQMSVYGQKFEIAEETITNFIHI